MIDRALVVRFLKFSVVGASGVFVNMGVFFVGEAYLFAAPELSSSARNVLAGVLAVAVSIVTNFTLNDLWTWGDRQQTTSGGGRLSRFARYVLVTSVAGVVQVGVLWTLSEQLGLNAYLSNFIGIAAGVGINFVVNNVWTFRKRDDTSEERERSEDRAR